MRHRLVVGTFAAQLGLWQSALLVVALIASSSTPAHSVTIFESAGFVAPGSGGGISLTTTQKFGYRFHLTASATTSTVGGHIVGSTHALVSIVALSGSSDFPDSLDLSTPDVLATAMLPAVSPSYDVSSPLVLTLDPGWYALVAWGPGGTGAVTNQNASAVNTFLQANSTGGVWANGDEHNLRFFISGTYVAPEPSTALLCGLGLAALAGARRLRS